MADKGQLPGWYVGALFQVMQNYGDAGTAPTWQQPQSKWNYHATMSLAGMQSGEGVPSLIRIAEDSPASGARAAAVEALAQVALQIS